MSVGELLNNPDRPLKERFRALFTLKNIGGALAIDWIGKGSPLRNMVEQNNFHQALTKMKLTFSILTWLKKVFFSCFIMVFEISAT